MESQDPESLILEWCALEDFHSGGMVYDREEFLEDQAGYEPDPDPEQTDSSQVQPLKRREALPIKIDPMDPATLGSGKVSLAQSNLRKNGYQTPAETLERCYQQMLSTAGAW